MIEYALQDEDLNEYELSGAGIALPGQKSVTFLNERFAFDSKVVENSALPGAVKLGSTRLESSRLALRVDRSFDVSSDWRDEVNEYVRQLAKAYYLVDKTNDRRARVNIEDFNFAFDEGGHKLSGRGTANIRLIEPFWEDITEQSDGPTALAVSLNTINLTNSGFLDTYPILTFTASVAVTDIDIFVDETSVGMTINDSLFGTSTYLTMVLDCRAGTLKIGDLDRSISIAPGTGYFSFPVGTVTLKIEPNAACSVTVTWRERYYV
jgi:hypothetical protein